MHGGSNVRDVAAPAPRAPRAAHAHRNCASRPPSHRPPLDQLARSLAERTSQNIAHLRTHPDASWGRKVATLERSRQSAIRLQKKNF